MGLIVAVVPALDEEATIAEVVRAAAEQVDEVCVVDDGSTDRTAELARAAGAHVISHGVNRGVGAAIASGLEWASGKGADVAVQLDGDGQHDAAFVPTLVARVRAGDDLVIGTRFEQGFEMSWARRTALRVFATLISWRLHHTISDPTSGYRAFSPAAMRALAPQFPTKYLSDTVEVLYLASDAGLAIGTVPVRMVQRRHGSSSVGPVKSAGYALRMVSIMLHHLVRRRPAR